MSGTVRLNEGSNAESHRVAMVSVSPKVQSAPVLPRRSVRPSQYHDDSPETAVNATSSSLSTHKYAGHRYSLPERHSGEPTTKRAAEGAHLLRGNADLQQCNRIKFSACERTTAFSLLQGTIIGWVSTGPLSIRPDERYNKGRRAAASQLRLA